jgi:NAD(P) transhydrogenase
MNERYDLAVIGSGPAGQRGAIAAAKLGKRVAIIDRPVALGGVCLHTGTIPSKTLREAILYLSGRRMRAFYGPDYAVKHQIRIEDLRLRVDQVVARQREVVRDQIQRNGIDFIEGLARFVDPHTLEVERDEGPSARLEADHVLVACGTRPARREDVHFERIGIRDADQIWETAEGSLPGSTVVIGGGVIGLEYASMLAAMGIAVTLVDARAELLEFVDREIVGHLLDHLQQAGMTFKLGQEVTAVRGSRADGVKVDLASGETLEAEAMLYAVGRQPNTDRLNLAAIGLGTDRRGRLEVNTRLQTHIAHIYAAGDVIGFPALASVSMEQGRVAACHMFGEPASLSTGLLPYGIYTIPEVSVVGETEHELASTGRAYLVGRSRFDELARAQIIGDRAGLLKIVFDPGSLRLLGVHLIGESASELVSIGQVIMSAGGTLETIRDTVFNYPTLAEAYKVAALDGLNRARASE